MALQAQALHDSKYGQNKYDPTDPYDYANPASATYYLVGWLDRCLRIAGLEQLKVPRVRYAEFLGVAAKAQPLAPCSSGYSYGDQPWASLFRAHDKCSLTGAVGRRLTARDENEPIPELS